MSVSVRISVVPMFMGMRLSVLVLAHSRRRMLLCVAFAGLIDLGAMFTIVCLRRQAGVRVGVPALVRMPEMMVLVAVRV